MLDDEDVQPDEVRVDDVEVGEDVLPDEVLVDDVEVVDEIVDDGQGEGCPGLEPITEPAEQLWVAPDGDDGATGTQDAPLASLAEAAGRFPDGGTVIMRGGIYPAQMGIAASGAEGHPLVVRPAEGEEPIIDAIDVQDIWSAAILFSSAQHVVIEGLEIRNMLDPQWTGAGISGGWGSPVLDLTIRNCHIHHVASSAISLTGSDIRIEGNDIHDAVLQNEDGELHTSAWGSCIATYPERVVDPSSPWAADIVVRANRVWNCWGENINMWYGSNAVIEDNVVEGPWCPGIYADNGFNIQIRRNFVIIPPVRPSGATGILMGSEPYDGWGIPYSPVHDVTIVNNVIVADAGIVWWRSPNTSPENTYDRVSILHNTVIAEGGNAFYFANVAAGSPPPTECSVKNNVLAGQGATENPGAFSVGGNAWLNEPLPDIAGATDESLDVAIGTITQATDVQSLVSLVGTGEAGTGVTEDFLCVPRSSTAPVRGAFEQ